MPSNHPILCHPLGPSIIPSIRVFSNESALCIKWPKYWSFSFNNSPSNEYSGLISFKINWFNLLAVQETLESSPAPQFKSINSSALSLFMVQLSNLYMTIGKTIALTMGFLSAKWYFCFLDLSYLYFQEANNWLINASQKMLRQVGCLMWMRECVCVCLSILFSP